jgi:hypothetical protein
MDSIIKCNDHYELLNSIIHYDTDIKILTDAINSIKTYDNITKVISNRNLWFDINPNDVPIEFLYKNFHKFREGMIANRTYIKLFEKYGRNVPKINWKFRGFGEDEYTYKLISFVAENNFISWRYISKNIKLSERFIIKNIDKVSFSEISINKKYKRCNFSEEFLLNYGNKIAWKNGPHIKIPQKVFEKYYDLIRGIYRDDYFVTEENWETYLKIKKSIKYHHFITRCNIEMFMKILKHFKRIKHYDYVLISSDDYDKLVEKNNIKLIIKFNYERICKRINLSEKFIDYIIKNNNDNIFRDIIIWQKNISERMLKKYMHYILKITQLHGNSPYHLLITYQSLSEKFIIKNIPLDNENIQEIIECQHNLSDGFIKKYYKKEDKNLLNHDIDEIKKIEIINILVHGYIEIENINIKLSEKIVDCFIKKFVNIKSRKFPYKNKSLKSIVTSIRNNIYQEKILNYIDTQIETKCKHIKITSIEYINYLKDIFKHQTHIPIKMFKKVAEISKIFPDHKYEFFGIILKNKNIQINKINGKILGVDPRLTSLIIGIKKFKDIKFNF